MGDDDLFLIKISFLFFSPPKEKGRAFSPIVPDADPVRTDA